MRILVLHSDVAPDAPPEEIDTLVSAEAVAQALLKNGHVVTQAPFTTDPDRLKALLDREKADVVFNMVEGIDGIGALAPTAPRMLDEAGAIFTGADAVAMALTSDKPYTKRKMREAGIGTADWAEGPDWSGLRDDTKYIVKSTLEDASVGLDDGCVCLGKDVIRRAEESAKRHGGKWFAEAYVDGREYNISVMQAPNGEPIVMPLAEMRFDDWPSDKPRIVGYGAKWDESLDINDQMIRDFTTEKTDPVLAGKLRRACEGVWKLFGLTGYCRVDFRVTPQGEPLVLEINTNPCIAPDAGFAAAGEQAGIPYDQLIVKLVDTALQSARG
jgi:D-alanine-D-alanine ligase